MVKFAPICLVFAAMFAPSACTLTEMTMAHDNPLDRIYDSGSVRLVLTGEAASATASTLTWGSVSYKNDKGSVKELTASDTQGAQMFYKSTAPTLGELDTVRNGGTLGYATATGCTISIGTGGNCTATVKGYFIIRATYNYDGKTAVFYSNFVVVQ